MQLNTRLVMTMAAILLGLLGATLSFMAREIATLLNVVNGAVALQLLGATYFAFAMINWMAKATLIGGIYGRPIAMGNFTHFMIGGLALIKHVMNAETSLYLIVLTVMYAAFALIYGSLLFTSPKLKTNSTTATS